MFLAMVEKSGLKDPGLKGQGLKPQIREQMSGPEISWYGESKF